MVKVFQQIGEITKFRSNWCRRLKKHETIRESGDKIYELKSLKAGEDNMKIVFSKAFLIPRMNLELTLMNLTVVAEIGNRLDLHQHSRHQPGRSAGIIGGIQVGPRKLRDCMKMTVNSYIAFLWDHLEHRLKSKESPSG